MTLDEYLDRYQITPTIMEIGDDVKNWSNVLVRFGNQVAVLQLIGIPADEKTGTGEHLCIDIRSFVNDEEARGGVFGMENGRRLDAFADKDANGTSHNFAATRLVTVIVGEQHDAEVEA